MKAATLLLVALLCVDAVAWTVFVSRTTGVAWLSAALAVVAFSRWLERQ